MSKDEGFPLWLWPVIGLALLVGVGGAWWFTRPDEPRAASEMTPAPAAKPAAFQPLPTVKPPVSRPPSPPAVRPSAVVPAEAPATRTPVATGRVAGAAWIVRGSGSSDVLRGLRVYVVRREVDKATATLAFESAREDWKKEQTNAEASSSIDPRDKERYAERARLAKEAQLQAAVRWNSLPARVDLAALWRESMAASRYGIASMSGAVAAVTVANGATNIDGKFAIENVPAGDYYIYALTANSVFSAEWLVPVTVPANGAASVDLYNETAIGIHNFR